MNESDRNVRYYPVVFGIVLLVAGCSALDRTREVPTDDADRKFDRDRYERAERFLSWNLSRHLIDRPSGPVWSGNDRFWYRIEEPEGDRFWRVDPDSGERTPAFDHSRLAEAIGEVAETRFRERRLPFRHFRYADDGDAVTFRYRNRQWHCNIIDYQCKEPSELPASVPSSVDSPDGRYAAYIEDFDLWVLDRETDKKIQLTEDGEPDYGYATDSQGWTRSNRPILKWSPDSRYIATFRQDDRDVGRMRLLESRQGRPVLDEWPYALPGDSIVPMLERVIIDVEGREIRRLDVEPSHQRASNCCGLVRDGRWTDVEWSPKADRLAFVSTARDYRTVTLYLADPQTGSVEKVYTETDEPFFESNLISRGIPNWRVLHESGEFIWFSRKSGWGHLYLHDLETGRKIRRLTEGEWNMMDLHRVDVESRRIWLTGVGREEGVNPYFSQFYRLSMDGGDPQRLTPNDDHHNVSLSPTGKYMVIDRSRPNRANVSELWSTDSQKVMELGRLNIDLLKAEGFRMPEPFVVKGRDGEEDLHGLLVKPSDFDPGHSYPLVVSIYPGPQAGSVGSRSFQTMRRGQAHAMAELGFVVMLLDGFGTPYRSKEFHTRWYGNMADNGLEDQVVAIRQLAERHSWIDPDRVGIYGHSGGGYATVAAMLRFPEIFRVGVAGAGNHDNRGYTFYWGEKYQGPYRDDSGEKRYGNQAIKQKADRLQGRLLITYGTMDDNVHPNMTLQLVDRLIAANRDFDLMVFPDRNHGYANEAYNLRLTWDYFVRHLLEMEPPRDYRIGR